MQLNADDLNIAVVGIGYVGLPLALELSKHFEVVGFDTNKLRVQNLCNNIDSNNEFSTEDLSNYRCKFTSNLDEISSANLYIITVPTPIDKKNEPDLSILLDATKAISKFVCRGDIIVYESTVYPGVTEDLCGPIIEEISGLRSNKDFHLGYSPERINPGDAEHTIDKITKVVSAQNSETLGLLAELYGKLNSNNVFKAKNIKTAEAAKAIENAQRDINIAFMNEVAMLLTKMDLTAFDVLKAAKTKWNFLPFSPGLVGGHCISVDPYYLAKKAIMVGHTPEILLSGRKINDSMGMFIAKQIAKFFNHVEEPTKLKNQKILVLGISFKENVNDIRNTKVIDIVSGLNACGYEVDVYDPLASSTEVLNAYGLNLLNKLSFEQKYDCVVLAVTHREFVGMSVEEIEGLIKAKNSIIYDIKGSWSEHNFSEPLRYFSL